MTRYLHYAPRAHQHRLSAAVIGGRAGAVMLFAVASLLLVAPAPGQKVGTSSMQFLKVVSTARGAAMGSSYASLANGAEAVYWNPARLTTGPRHSIAVDRVNWFVDVAHHAFAYSGKLGQLGSFGIHAYFTDVGAIEETTVDDLGFVSSGGQQVYNPGLTGATFTPRSYVVGVSYARELTDRFSAGLSAKYAHEDLWLSSAGVPLFDFGISYGTGFRSVQIGASVVNFGPPVEFESESYPAPMTFRIGVSADVVGLNGLLQAPSDVNRLTVSYDLIQPNDYDQQWAAGLEYMFMDRLAIRGGYQFNFDLESFSLGAGFRQPLGKIQLAVDYAYSDMDSFFDAVHRFSLSIGLE